MKAEEKKALVTARLAELLREVDSAGQIEEAQVGGYWHSVAGVIMDGRTEVGASEDPDTMVTARTPGLWDVIAPFIQSLLVREAIEQRLTHYSGMPLTQSVVGEIMTEVDRVIDTVMGPEEVVMRRGRSHSQFGSYPTLDEWAAKKRVARDGWDND